MQACGFSRTLVVSTSVEYKPVSTGHKSCTIYYYKDGKRKILTGCRGNVSFDFTVGGICKASFTMTGHDAIETDTALIGGTYDSTVPPPFINSAFTVGAYSMLINALTFDVGNELALLPDVNQANGYGEILITQRDVNGSLDPQEALVASHDFETNFRNGTSLALATGVIGSTANNRVQVNMPALYYSDLSGGEREGVRTKEITFNAADSAGDDEVSIKFT